MSANFNATVFVTEQLERLMANAAQELAQRAVTACAEHYMFDSEEAIRLLGLNMVKVERKNKEKVEKELKVVEPKQKFPLPYNGELNTKCCYALRQNNGLYTQCTGLPKGDNKFCKGCVKLMQKMGSDMPEYGTIEQRQAVGIFEYVDPKGRKPVSYTKIMKKLKITKEEVLEEAGKLNIIIDANHFIAPDDTKKGRKPKAEKEPKLKGTKGRPKKEKKVLQIEDGDDEDLFAALVSEANADEDASPKKKVVSDEERAALKQAEEDEKAAKAAKKEEERLEREAKKKAEEEAKLAKKKAEEEAKAAKKKAEEEAKAAKKKAEEEAKADKLAKKEKERQEREAKKNAKGEAKKNAEEGKEEETKGAEEEEEQEVVKKIEYEGKKYLKSKKSGIIYDYTKYVREQEQVPVGKWNEQTNKIVFNVIEERDEEEEEEEYDDM